MDLIAEHNRKYQFFADITGVAMKVHSKYHGGLHVPYGMLINFGPKGLFSEWYVRHSDGDIEKVKLF